MSLSTIPEDVTWNTLSYCDVQTLFRCCGVNRRWSKLASDDSVWRLTCSQLGLSPPTNNANPPTNNAKEYLAKYLPKHAVGSVDELEQRILASVQRISPSRIHLFTCMFPLNPQCKITIQLASTEGQVTAQSTPFSTETCIFMKTFVDNDACKTTQLIGIRINETIRSSFQITLLSTNKDMKQWCQRFYTATSQLFHSPDGTKACGVE